MAVAYCLSCYLFYWVSFTYADSDSCLVIRLVKNKNLKDTNIKYIYKIQTTN
jgi:hypothetical protein